MRYRFTMFLIIAFIIAACLLAGGCSKKSDISGTWKGKITLPATGKSLSDLEFSLMQKGKEVTGTMVFTKPGAKLPLTGTVTEGKVSLSSPLKNGLAISFSGTLESRRKISGAAILNYDMPQLGKRQDKTTLELTR
jgi:CTP:molybdopterin cytidylyltransferase MocA